MFFITWYWMLPILLNRKRQLLDLYTFLYIFHLLASNLQTFISKFLIICINVIYVLLTIWIRNLTSLVDHIKDTIVLLMLLSHKFYNASVTKHVPSKLTHWYIVMINLSFFMTSDRTISWLSISFDFLTS